MMIFRKILFYVFLFLYFTICPLLILYTLGYVYQTKGEDPGLVRTGAISISTLPDDAVLFLNDRKLTQKTPAVLLNLVPGNYALRAEKAGYVPWEANFDVTAERVISLEKVILLPEVLKTEAVVDGKTESFFSVRDKETLLVVRGARFRDISLLDLSRRMESPLFKLAGALPAWSDAPVHVYPAPAESRFIWLWVEEGAGHMLRIRLDSRTPEIEEWSALFPVKPDAVEWTEGEDSRVFVLRQGALVQIDLDRKKAQPLFEGVDGFCVYKQKLFVIREGNILRTDTDGGHARKLLDDPMLSKELFEEGKKIRVQAYPEGILIFLNADGALFTNRVPYWIGRRKMRGFSYDNEHGQAVFWSAKRIAALRFPKDTFLREEAFDHKLRKRWVYEDGNDLTQVLWIAGGTQLLFQDGGGLYLFQPMPGLKTSPRLLADAEPGGGLFFSETLGQLYFIEKSSHRLMEMRLVARRELLSAALEAFRDETTANQRKDDAV